MSEQFKNPIEGSQRETQLIPLTHQIHDRSLSWLDTATSMKRCVMGPNHLGKVVKELM